MYFPAKSIHLVGQVEIDPALGCVRREGKEQHLRQKTFQVLLYLLDRRERLVTKQELIEHVWRGAAVTDDALVQCIVDIRKALGDDCRRPRYIKTVPKAGYRFIASFEEPEAFTGRSQNHEDPREVSEFKEKNFIHEVTRRDTMENRCRFLLSFVSLRVTSWMKKTVGLLVQLNRKE